jgi:hypothetical protein
MQRYYEKQVRVREVTNESGENKRRKLRRRTWMRYSSYKNEYRNFKPVENTVRSGLRHTEEIQRRRIKSAIIHMNMEVPQGNFLCSYLKQQKHAFLLLLLFFYKIREQIAE